MKTVSFTDFRKNASHLFDDVENGEHVMVFRHGRPIAEISPVRSSPKMPSWKETPLRLKISGADLSAAILSDRDDEDMP